MGSNRLLLAAASLVAVVVVVGCGNDDTLTAATSGDNEGSESAVETEIPAPAASLVDTYWVLETLIDGEVAVSVLLERSESELEMVLGPDYLESHDSCSAISGRYSLDGARLVFAADFTFETECAGELAHQSQHVVDVLSAEPELRVEGDRLRFIAPDGRGLTYRAVGTLDAPPIDPDAEPPSEHQVFLNDLEERFGETFTLPACSSGQAVSPVGTADAGESISAVEWEAVVSVIASPPQSVDPNEAVSTVGRVDGDAREGGKWTVRDTQGDFLGTVSTFRADDGGWNVGEAEVCVG